jgi:uncharacterized protein (TIGR03435 family)
MRRFGGIFGSSRKLLLNAAGLVAATVPLVFGLAHATRSRGQSQAQSAAANPSVFEYDVASIKPNDSGSANIGWRTPADGFTATNVSLKYVIKMAYRVEDVQIAGAPNWLGSEKYDIDAKMDVSVAAELQKLSPDDRRLARQHMLQALLADRFKLTVHRETRELPVYSLVIGKNGPILQETKPDPSAPPAPGPAASRGGSSIRISKMSSGPATMTALHTSASDLADSLSVQLGRTVLDKTGLTSRYDFTLKWTADDAQLPLPSGRAPPPSLTTDPSGPTLFTAVQEQLGLKLEPGKGPVEVVVIDHVERPSGN